MTTRSVQERMRSALMHPGSWLLACDLAAQELDLTAASLLVDEVADAYTVRGCSEHRARSNCLEVVEERRQALYEDLATRLDEYAIASVPTMSAVFLLACAMGSASFFVVAFTVMLALFFALVLRLTLIGARARRTDRVVTQMRAFGSLRFSKPR